MDNLTKALENIGITVNEISSVLVKDGMMDDVSVIKAMDILRRKARLLTLLRLEEEGKSQLEMASILELTPARISQLLKEARISHGALQKSEKKLIITEHNALNSEHGYFYRSNRDLPLMWRKAPLDKPILTVEHYCKWYDLFLVMPDGTVKSVMDDFRDEWDDATDKWGGIYQVDHTYNPNFIQVLAYYLGAYIDSEAHELIAGRWAIETAELYESSGLSFDNEEEVDDFISSLRSK